MDQRKGTPNVTQGSPRNPLILSSLSSARAAAIIPESRGSGLRAIGRDTASRLLKLMLHGQMKRLRATGRAQSHPSRRRCGSTKDSTRVDPVPPTIPHRTAPGAGM